MLLGKGRDGVILTVENLEVHYGRAKVLHNIAFKMDEGELVTIVGRNGSGKTTLLKTLGGFLKPSAGSILFRGQRIDGLGPENVALKGIRYVFQDKRVFGELTVKENIELAAYPIKENLEKAVQKVLSVYPRLEKFLHSKAKGLSGGERQILLIGRVLIGQPQLLLIDEPTEGLAAKIISEITAILLSMKGQFSMIVVEQNLATVARLADKIHIMKEGVMFKEITDPEMIRQPSQYENDL